jgi:hypothetical protein
MVYIDLINHVWGRCIKSESGRELFHGDTIAKKFIGPEADWIDAFRALHEAPEIRVHAFYIDGIMEKIFEAQIDPIYCHPEYKKLALQMCKRDLKTIPARAARS